MGLFSNNGYVPSARDNYMRGLKEQDYQRRRADSQFDAARKIRDGIPALIEKEQEKIKRDAQAVVSGIRKSAEAERNAFSRSLSLSTVVALTPTRTPSLSGTGEFPCLSPSTSLSKV